MPNHCTNFLCIMGSRSEVDAFLKDNENTLDFNKYIPRLDDELEDDCDWCYKNWGTKWNAYNVNVHLNTLPDCRYSEYNSFARIYITYSTAWGPSISVIKKMMETYKHLDITLDWFTTWVEACGSLSCVQVEEYDDEWNETDNAETPRKVFRENELSCSYYGSMGS